jgi:hypothetical protein
LKKLSELIARRRHCAGQGLDLRCRLQGAAEVRVVFDEEQMHAPIVASSARRRANVKAAILAQGQEPRSDSRASFAAMVKSDDLRSRDVISKAGIKLE